MLDKKNEQWLFFASLSNDLKITYHLIQFFQKGKAPSFGARRGTFSTSSVKKTHFLKRGSTYQLTVRALP